MIQLRMRKPPRLWFWPYQATFAPSTQTRTAGFRPSAVFLTILMYMLVQRFAPEQSDAVRSRSGLGSIWQLSRNSALSSESSASLRNCPCGDTFISIDAFIARARADSSASCLHFDFKSSTTRRVVGHPL